MLIQVAINNIESIEEGEEILKKWHYHLDEDQSHVVVERDVDGVTVRISGFHPWADEMGEDGEECSCGGGDCCKEGDEHTEGGSYCCQGGDDAADGKDKEAEDDEGEESEVIYLGQALFMPAEDQARVLANELMDDDYIGTVSVSMAGVELTDTDAFRALPADTKNAVIVAIEELGDAEAYLSMYEVMGLKD
ncbi:hypothetical protein [Candidatus Cryosericum septentrionale]|uniref:Uncharacterized protein n=1 Tax=Candidatus Cryosericum septentrionale TaxID=2290913 RepID=A0A398DQP1_9BACT|nr:hypothetical protein [Candidatus Cryosericum septentrionale]RIE17565.1 hypothetical protein SMC1_01185 [Candidatus Cryosericum septentrionale]